MKSGICTKCGSNKVFSAENLPLKGGPFGSNSIPISLTVMAALDNYVCADCGLVESYLADADKLKTVADKWERVKTENGSEN
jgi:hypothetical protein